MKLYLGAQYGFHRFLRHSQIFEQLFMLINTKEVFLSLLALQYR